MPLKQIEVFEKRIPDGYTEQVPDIFKPVSQIPIPVNAKLEKLEKAHKHMPKELEDYPI